jgi:hypothetical protein
MRASPFILGQVGYLGRPMFANLTRFITQSPDPSGEPFVAEVSVTRPVPADPKVERMILLCWILIAVKHVLVIWAVQRYPVPFHQLWVNFPTFLLGLLATWAYYARE